MSIWSKHCSELYPQLWTFNFQNQVSTFDCFNPRVFDCQSSPQKHMLWLPEFLLHGFLPLPLFPVHCLCFSLYCFPPVLHSIKKWRENEYVKEILFRKSYNDLLYVRVLISAVVLTCVWMVWEDSLQEQVPSYLVDPGDPI